VEFKSFEAPAGERLDVAISQSLAMSRTYAKELVNDGYVTLDGKPVGKPATRLQGEEIVSVAIPPQRPMVIEPEDIDVDMIYEDEYMAVINKPPGLVAHPTATVRTGTVVNALMGRMRLSKEKVFEPTSGEYRPGIVHRLDKETSGVMVVAKTDDAHRHLARSFKQRLTVKEYVAIGVGSMDPRVDLDAPIGRHPVRRQSMTVGGTSPKTARTRFRILAKTPDHVLVKAKPHSGRTHQIRVHMLHLGAPVLGDDVYGRRSQVIDRQALHAFRLSIPHPHDNHAVTFSARVPEDMVSAWLAVGGGWPPDEEPELI
jgi:23S rRNA pseudouridine1911/1915/1917 synthase